MRKSEVVINYIKDNAKGKENVISSKIIEQILSISGSEIRAYVNKARQNGMPICSCKDGYYYSDKKEDLSETILHLESRILKVKDAINGLNNLLLEAQV